MTSARAPVRALFFRPTLGQGGADRVTATLLREFDRSRIAPELVLLKKTGEHLDTLPSDVVVHELPVERLRQCVLPLARLIRRVRPDVLVSTSGGGNAPTMLAAKLARFPGRVVLSERNMLWRSTPSLATLVNCGLKAVTYPISDGVIAVSGGVASDLRRKIRLSGRLIHVVDNPVVDDALTAMKQEAPQHWPAGEGPVVLAAGRFVPEKGFATLLEAFSLLPSTLGARLLILGDGPLREQLESQVAHLGLEQRVFMPGFDANPFAYMARADAFVLSSEFEGMPGVLIQALACGAAVVSTDCPSGPSEVIEDGVNGFLVPVGDAVAIADRLGRLLQDPALAARLSEAAPESVRRFGVAESVERYTQLVLGETDDQ